MLEKNVQDHHENQKIKLVLLFPFLAIKGKERIKGIKIGNYSKIDEWKKDVFHLKKSFQYKSRISQEKRVERARGREIHCSVMKRH